MVDVLERIAEKSNSLSTSRERSYSGEREYSDRNTQGNENYSTFAEMYLEKPVDVQAGFTVTVCTWRGVPTVDDW